MTARVGLGVAQRSSICSAYMKIQGQFSEVPKVKKGNTRHWEMYIFYGI